MHAGRVKPDEERCVGLVCTVNKVKACGQEFLIHCLHSLGVERPRVFDFLRSIRLRPAMEDAAWPKFLSKFRVFWIVRVFGFLLRIQVIEVSEEFIESMCGR